MRRWSLTALAPDAAQEAFAEGVRAGRADGCPRHLNATAHRNACKLCAELGLVVADQEARRQTERCGLAQLWGEPSVGRMPRHADMDDPSRAQVDDKEGEERAEAQVDERQDVAGPHVMGMVVNYRQLQQTACPSATALAAGDDRPIDGGPPAAVMPLLARSLAATLKLALRSAFVRYPHERHHNSDGERRLERC